MKTTIRIITALGLAMLVLAGCVQQEDQKPLEEITVQLSWLHQAQFAGFYAADQHGYYAEERLNVHLLPRSDPNTDVFAQVLDRRADFSLSSGLAVGTARARGSTITAIAAILRRSPKAFITLIDSGITRPQDFPGHTVRNMEPGITDVDFRAMMIRLGLNPDSVRQVEAGYDLAPFFAGEVDIWPAFLTEEVLIARAQGYQVNIILPSDYGVHSYRDVLFASEQLIQDDPDLVLRFLRATLRGWRWAIENPEEASLLVLEYDPSMDKAHQLALMEASVPLIHTGEDQIGWMRPEIWQGTYDMLLEQGLLDGPVDVDRTYTLEFLQLVYPEMR